MSVVTEAIENINRKLLLLSNSLDNPEEKTRLIEECFVHLAMIAGYVQTIARADAKLHIQAQSTGAKCIVCQGNMDKNGKCPNREDENHKIWRPSP